MKMIIHFINSCEYILEASEEECRRVINSIEDIKTILHCKDCVIFVEKVLYIELRDKK